MKKNTAETRKLARAARVSERQAQRDAVDRSECLTIVEGSTVFQNLPFTRIAAGDYAAEIKIGRNFYRATVGRTTIVDNGWYAFVTRVITEDDGHTYTYVLGDRITFTLEGAKTAARDILAESRI